MIEYLNNPALLVLACEVLVFMTIANVVLLVILTKRNNKTVESLNALVSEIKSRGEEHKQKMTELLLQPELLDPEAIKQGMQELVSGQMDLYKGMIKAIRTQSEDDVVALEKSVSGLVDSAIQLGRESGEGSVDKEAQTRLEENNEELQKANGELKEKLVKTTEEMDELTDEYKSMMGNVQDDEPDSENNESESNIEGESEQQSPNEASLEISDDVVDVSTDDEQVEEETDPEQELPDNSIDIPLSESNISTEGQYNNDDSFDGMDDDVVAADTEASNVEGEAVQEAASEDEKKKDEAA